ncbi:MAG: sel1 repeat family protein [Defluviitaleaceae bacterium]|nr:sel1 repeat family protein [Defluviitaleaceae bacterium]
MESSDKKICRLCRNEYSHDKETCIPCAEPLSPLPDVEPKNWLRKAIEAIFSKDLKKVEPKYWWLATIARTASGILAVIVAITAIRANVGISPQSVAEPSSYFIRETENQISTLSKISFMEEIVEQAEAGDVRAQFELGLLYRDGFEPSIAPQNDFQAAFWFREAAKHGYAEGQSALGWMYEQGRGVLQDNHRAILWFYRAAKQGNYTAQFNLGLAYMVGRGVLQDDYRAALWFFRAAVQGFAIAQFNLGWMYWQGRGVPQDDYRAAIWYREAAEQQHAAARFNLGWMYEQGHGIPQNFELAVAWYNMAASQGFELAIERLESLEIEVMPAPAPVRTFPQTGGVDPPKRTPSQALREIY